MRKNILANIMQIKELTAEIVVNSIQNSRKEKARRKNVLNLLYDGIERGLIEFDISKISYLKFTRKTHNLFTLSETYLSTERFVKTYDLMIKFQPDFSLWKMIWDTKHFRTFISMTPLKMAIINQNIDLFEEIIRILMNTEAPAKVNQHNPEVQRFELHYFIEKTIIDKDLRAKFFDVLENREKFRGQKRKRDELSTPSDANELELAVASFLQVLQSSVDISNPESSEEDIPAAKRQKTKESTQDDTNLKPIINFANPEIPAHIVHELPDGTKSYELML